MFILLSLGHVLDILLEKVVLSWTCKFLFLCLSMRFISLSCSRRVKRSSSEGIWNGFIVGKCFCACASPFTIMGSKDV